MREFIYKLFKLDWEPEHCANCDRLYTLLEDEKRRHDRIIAEMIGRGNRVETPMPLPENFKPIGNRPMPWAVRKQGLEQADRIRAAELRRAGRTEEEKTKIEALERELAVPTEELSGEQVKEQNG